MKMKTTTTWIAGLTLAAGLTASAAEPEGWHFEVTPYLWAAGLEGDVTMNGQKTDFDKSASDLFDALDIGGSLFGMAQYNRFVLGAQVDFFSLSTDEMDVEDQPQGGKLDSDMLLTQAAVGYMIDGWMEGQTFTIAVGVRNLHMENDLEVYGVQSISRKNDITDPYVVVWPVVPLFPSVFEGRLVLNPIFSIGGGGDSKITYELFPQLRYQINDMVQARIGYRTVGYKFEGEDNEDNEVNINLAGLIVGVGVTF